MNDTKEHNRTHIQKEIYYTIDTETLKLEHKHKDKKHMTADAERKIHRRKEQFLYLN